MRVLIAAVGKLKDAEERAIADRYATRFDGAGKVLGLGPLSFRELAESRAASADERKREEALRLVKEAGKSGFIVALDSSGSGLSSDAFARLLATKRDEAVKACAFLIGGPDGHGEAALRAAHMRLSLGPMTLPHGLARVVLIEQLYRAVTILSGHPYHRA